VQAARALGRRAIISQGWADLCLENPEPDCLVISEVNQQVLFPRVAAVIHHGGAGTTTAAALAGTPQVIIPQRYDQPYWAARIQALGIGATHAPGTPTIESLTDALQLALQSEILARARALAPSIRTDGALIAAKHLIGTGWADFALATPVTAATIRDSPKLSLPFRMDPVGKFGS
jgi:vancomycin aglycone glucosyltransferase